MTHTLEELAQRLERAEQRQSHAEAQLGETKKQLARSSRHSRVSGGVAALAVGASLLLNVRPAALAQTPGVSLAALLSRLSAVEQKTAPITTTGSAASGYLVTITKANVQIVNGLGATNGEPASPTDINHPVVNGLGNLILGYNSLRGDGTDARTGSHNLVLGDQNNYSSFGGLVAGFGSVVSGPDSAVVGGVFGVASGTNAVVIGSDNNQATGQEAVAVGGTINVSAGQFSTTIGGFGDNVAGQDAVAVAGGGLTQSAFKGFSAGGDLNPVFHSP